MNAEIKIRGKTECSLPAEKFFARIPKQLLKSGELVTEIVFPPVPKGTRASFYAFGLTEIDFALLKVAVRLVRRQRLCREIVIVACGGTLLPQRLRGAEEILRGKKGSQILVNESSEKAAEEVKVAKDIRCGKDYKRQLCRVMVRAVLEDILLDQKVAEWKLF